MAYVDFEALFRINNQGKFLVTRAKETIRYRVIEESFNINQSVGLRSDKIIVLTIAKSKGLYPEKLRIVEFYDEKNDEDAFFLYKYREKHFFYFNSNLFFSKVINKLLHTFVSK